MMMPAWQEADPFLVTPLQVAMAALAEAVRSLYVDRIIPEVSTVRKRLEEIYPSEFQGRVTERYIISFIQRVFSDRPMMNQECSFMSPGRLTVKTESDAKGRPQQLVLFVEGDSFIPQNFTSFVDPMSSDWSLYPDSVWQGLELYVDDLASTRDPNQYTFPGGRYGTARILKELNLPALKGLSLGELCHIVQGLIMKNIMAYGKQGTIVPFRLSLSAVKAVNAQHHRPTFMNKHNLGPSSGGLHDKSDMQGLSLDPLGGVLPVIETHRQLVQVFESILFPECQHPSPRTLLLSNVKAEIRERFGMELSETRLGFTKLVELIQSPPLSEGICKLSWRKNNPVILPHDEMVRRGKPLSDDLLPNSFNWEAGLMGAREEPLRYVSSSNRPVMQLRRRAPVFYSMYQHSHMAPSHIGGNVNCVPLMQSPSPSADMMAYESIHGGHPHGLHQGARMGQDNHVSLSGMYLGGVVGGQQTPLTNVPQLHQQHHPHLPANPFPVNSINGAMPSTGYSQGTSQTFFYSEASSGLSVVDQHERGATDSMLFGASTSQDGGHSFSSFPFHPSLSQQQHPCQSPSFPSLSAVPSFSQVKNPLATEPSTGKETKVTIHEHVDRVALRVAEFDQRDDTDDKEDIHDCITPKVCTPAPQPILIATDPPIDGMNAQPRPSVASSHAPLLSPSPPIIHISSSPAAGSPPFRQTLTPMASGVKGSPNGVPSALKLKNTFLHFDEEEVVEGQAEPQPSNFYFSNYEEEKAGC